ncbi:hypothetical protein ACU686_34110 [Yinghuangia aomiensis]
MGDGGDPDGYTSRDVFLPVTAALQLGTGALLAATVWWTRGTSGGQRATTATATGLAGFLTYLDVMLLAANHGVDDAHDVRFALWHLGAAAGCAAVTAALGWFAAGASPPTTPPPAPRRRPTPGTWPMRTAPNGWSGRAGWPPHPGQALGPARRRRSGARGSRRVGPPGCCSARPACSPVRSPPCG